MSDKSGLTSHHPSSSVSAHKLFMLFAAYCLGCSGTVGEPLKRSGKV